MATKVHTLRPLLKPTAIKPHHPSRTPPNPLLKPYHSQTHPPPAPPFTPTERTILAAATPHIPAHGFTLTALSLGAKKEGYVDAAVNLFPRGAFALVQWHLWTRRQVLKGKMEEIEIVGRGRGGEKGIGVGGKVVELTWERLLGNREVVGRWQEALALMALPSNIPPSLHELRALADEIWYLAGDTSVDGSWYTKRASLASIYAASELFMTTDQSAGFEETRRFMERRFGDVRAVGDVVGGVGEWLGFGLGSVVRVARSKGVRI